MSVRCPCGLEDATADDGLDQRTGAAAFCRARFDELSLYTISRGRERFIHQHVVDAWGAQHLHERSPGVAGAFALAGLYLAIERGFSGLQVQNVHIFMARRSSEWPRFGVSPHADLAVADALAASTGAERDEAILRWCRAVWLSWASEHARVKTLVKGFL